MTAVIARRRAIEPRETAPARGLERCIRERAEPWPPSLPEFRALCQPIPAGLGLPRVEEAYRVACLQKPDWQGVRPLVWHARQAVGGFELASLPERVTRPRFEAVYQALVQRALKAHWERSCNVRPSDLPKLIRGGLFWQRNFKRAFW